MQGDGNFVVYDGSNNALWSSKTNGNPGAYLVVGNAGEFGVRSTGGDTLWMPGSLVAGNVLAAGQSLTSPARRYRLTMQGDGNLVEYNAAGTPSGIRRPPWRARRQSCRVTETSSSTTRRTSRCGRAGRAVTRARISACAIPAQLNVESATGTLLWAGPGELTPRSTLTRRAVAQFALPGIPADVAGRRKPGRVRRRDRGLVVRDEFRLESGHAGGRESRPLRQRRTTHCGLRTQAATPGRT